MNQSISIGLTLLVAPVILAVSATRGFLLHACML